MGIPREAPSTMALIDIAAMTRLVSALDNALAELPGHKSSLNGILDRVGVSTEPATRLDKVISWGTTERPSLERRRSLAIWIEAQNPSLNGVGVARIDESHISSVPPGVAVQNGKDAAKALLAAGGEPGEDLIAQITAAQNDPYFAQGFASAATPQQLAQVPLAMSRSYDSLSMTQATMEQRVAWQHQYDAMLSAVGTTIGTATYNVGDLKLPSGYAQQWVDTITEKRFADSNRDGDSHTGHAVDGQGGAAAQFLKYGTFSTPFLTTVADGVYDYERANADGGRPLWEPRSFTIDGYTYDGAYEGGPLAGPNDKDPLKWAGPVGRPGFDPMSSVLAGLGHNPEAAQDFFTSGGNRMVKIDGFDTPVNARLQYLTQERKWPTDDGDGLGNAIEAGTTVFRNREATGAASATIAAQTIRLLGSKSGDDGKDFQVPEGMRDSMSVMLSSYMSDLWRVVPSGAGDGQVGVGGAWTTQTRADLAAQDGPIGLLMNKADLAKLVMGIGLSDDKSASGGLVAGGLAYQKDMVDKTIAGIMATDPKAPLTRDAFEHLPGIASLQDQAQLSGQVLAFLVQNGYRGGTANQAIEDAQREQLGQIFDAATFFMPGPSGKIASFAVDQAKSAIRGGLTAPVEDKAGKWATDSDNQVKESQEYMLYNSLLQAGYLDPAKDPKGLPPGTVEYVTVTDPDGTTKSVPQVKSWLLDDDGQHDPDFDPQVKAAYDAWHGNEAPIGKVGDFAAAYSLAFPVFHG